MTSAWREATSESSQIRLSVAAVAKLEAPLAVTALWVTSSPIKPGRRGRRRHLVLLVAPRVRRPHAAKWRVCPLRARLTGQVLRLHANGEKGISHDDTVERRTSEPGHRRQ